MSLDPGETTDYQALVRICEHLGLARYDHAARPHLFEPGRMGSGVGGREYAADGRRVAIGAGGGYGYFYGVFTFDEAGRAVSHGFWE